MNLAYFNPFSKDFLKGDKEKDAINDEQVLRNAQGFSEEDQYSNYSAMPDMGPGVETFVAPMHFNDNYKHKKAKITKYREMSLFPEVSEALDIICDDAIIKDEKGQIVKLQFNKELKAKDERLIQDEFNYLIHNVFKKKRIYKLYKKWIVEGELFLELVVNDKKDSIIGIKRLAAYKTAPIYREGIIDKFIQVNDNEDISGQYGVGTGIPKDAIVFPKEQIAYAYWDLNDYGKDKTDVRGYLEPAVRTYNQLRSLEDAIVVYRLVRAPERRVWNIEIGKMPAGKAAEYVKKLSHKYKKQLHYNPDTGLINSSQNVQAMTEDYWFTQRDGAGSRIDTVGGGMNLGEMEDIKYFLTKLYKVLKMPKDRFQDVSTQYNPGRNLEREEIRFSKFIGRTLDCFQDVFMDALIQQLRFKGFDKELLDRSLYEIKFTESNFYKQFKKMEIIEAKINIWSSMSSYVTSPEEPNAPFAAEFVMREWCQMTDDEIELNNKYKKREKEEALKAAREEAELAGANELASAEASGALDDEEDAEEKPKIPPKKDEKDKEETE